MKIRVGMLQGQVLLHRGILDHHSDGRGRVLQPLRFLPLHIPIYIRFLPILLTVHDTFLELSQLLVVYDILRILHAETTLDAVIPYAYAVGYTDRIQEIGYIPSKQTHKNTPKPENGNTYHSIFQYNTYSRSSPSCDRKKRRTTKKMVRPRDIAQPLKLPLPYGSRFRFTRPVWGVTTNPISAKQPSVLFQSTCPI